MMNANNRRREDGHNTAKQFYNRTKSYIKQKNLEKLLDRKWKDSELFIC